MRGTGNGLSSYGYVCTNMRIQRRWTSNGRQYLLEYLRPIRLSSRRAEVENCWWVVQWFWNPASLAVDFMEYFKSYLQASLVAVGTVTNSDCEFGSVGDQLEWIGDML